MNQPIKTRNALVQIAQPATVPADYVKGEPSPQPLGFFDRLWLMRLRGHVMQKASAHRTAREWREYWEKEEICAESELLAAQRQLEQAEMHAGFRSKIGVAGR